MRPMVSKPILGVFVISVLTATLAPARAAEAVVGGTELQLTTIGGAPFIGHYHASRYNFHHLFNPETRDCGVTAISTAYALTAAHCVLDGKWSAGNITLTFNSPVADSGGERRRVKQVIYPPGVNPHNDSYDLAILELDSQLPQQWQYPPLGGECADWGPGTSLITVGWGQGGGFGHEHDSPPLQRAQLSTQSYLGIANAAGLAPPDAHYFATHETFGNVQFGDSGDGLLDNNVSPYHLLGVLHGWTLIAGTPSPLWERTDASSVNASFLSHYGQFASTCSVYTSPAPSSRPGSSAETTQLQWNLAGLGYMSPSRIDGQYGPITAAAVRAFQADACVRVDGIAGSETNGAFTRAVKRVQAAVKVSQDGLFGPTTRGAVASWQRAHGLNSDGQAGPNTMAAMGIPRAACPSGDVTGNLGVRQLQWNLAGLGYLAWRWVDGLSGPVTARAVRAFQADACLDVDGIAGPRTGAALTAQVSAVQTIVRTRVDGAYGPTTRDAVRTWQESRPTLAADGQAGPESMQAMGLARTRCTHVPDAPSDPPVATNGALAEVIVKLAEQELHGSNRNYELGGYNCNYYSTALRSGNQRCANGWLSEEWCADFARWVWQQSGANTHGLNGAAASFYQYGAGHGTWHSNPRVGDAIVFNLDWTGSQASHVGIVTGTTADTVTVISGNTYNPDNGQDDHVGLSVMSRSDMSISGYTAAS